MDNQKPKSRKNAQKYFLNPNTVYGNYKTLEQVEYPTDKCIETRWKCIHIPSGEIKFKKSCDLAKYQTGEEQQKRLEELVKNDQHQMGFRNYLYRSSKSNAEKRHHGFNLSFDEFMNIIKKDCYYCGEPPHPASEKLIKDRGNTKEPTFYYNGIDRINPDLDYSIGNCVPCCSKCNYMKHVYQKEDFLNQIVKIYNHLDLGSTTISKESTSQANGDGSEGPFLVEKQEGEDIV